MMIKDRTRAIVYFLAVLTAAMMLGGLKFLTQRPAAQMSAPPLVFSTGTISGSLDDTLKKYGFDDNRRFQISKAFAKTLNLRRLQPQDVYTICFSTAAEFKYIFITKELNNHYVFPRAKGAYAVSVRPLALESRQDRVKGIIKSSLWESMSAAGVPPDLILDYADVFSWSVDFLTEVRDGDKYDLVYEVKLAPNGRAVSKKIVAAVYDGATAGRQIAGAYGKGYYDAKGDSVRSLFLRAPLHYRRISSYFTYKRFHPILKYVRPHLGIDYSAPSGTPVSTVADGTVIFSGWKGGNGRFVEIRHAAGYSTSYGHLRSIAGSAAPGRRVSQGTVIGYVGSTGISTGPHLDFRVKQNGKPINFLKIKYRATGGLSGKDKDLFLSGLKTLLPEYF